MTPGWIRNCRPDKTAWQRGVLLPWWVWQGPSRSWPVAGDPQGGGEWKEWQGQENCRTWEVNFAVML